MESAEVVDGFAPCRGSHLLATRRRLVQDTPVALDPLTHRSSNARGVVEIEWTVAFFSVDLNVRLGDLLLDVRVRSLRLQSAWHSLVPLPELLGELAGNVVQHY